MSKDYNLTEEKQKEAEEYLKRFAESRNVNEEFIESTALFKNYIKYLKERK